MPHLDPIQPDEAFRALRKAQVKGHRIIPLLGSGISIDAGIPTSNLLADYITALYGVFDSQHKQVFDYLHKRTWPSRHDTWSDWYAMYADMGYGSLASEFKKLRKRLCAECSIFELRTTSPLFSQLVRIDDDRFDKLDSSLSAYRSFLSYVTENESHLVDAFFDRLIRDNSPAGAHQFIAFLARLLRMRLILTTNFDPLIEDALRSEGLHPTVYEIGQHAELPSPTLLNNQPLSLLKLHGGTHDLRTGFDLDEPLSSQSLQQFRYYLRPEQVDSTNSHVRSLLLVIGYSGTDRRVMDIVNDHINSWRRDDLPAVLWVTYDGKPPRHLRTSAYDKDTVSRPILLCQYKSGHLFLQELYQVLANQFPISHTSYRTFLSVPRVPTPAAIRKYGDRVKTYDNESRFVLFWGHKEGSGTSTILHQYVEEKFSDSYEIIWIDACDIRTRADLFAQLADALTRRDRGNVRLTRPLFLQDVDYLDARWEVEPTLNPPAIPQKLHEYELKTAVRWLKRAMRRANYIIAIDSLGEFAHAHPAFADTLEPPNQAKEQRLSLLKLLGALCRESVQFGRSIIVCALTPMFTDCSPDDRMYADYGIEQQKSLASADFTPFAKLYPEDQDAAASAEQAASLATSRADWSVRILMDLLTNPEDTDAFAIGILTLLSSFFRRPRSRTALRVAFIRFIAMLREVTPASNTPPGLSKCLMDIEEFLSRDDSPLALSAAADRSTIRESYFDELLATATRPPIEWMPSTCTHDVNLSDHNNDTARPVDGSDELHWSLLSHLEGGYYWMHLESRNAIFRTTVNDKKLQWLSKEHCARVFDGLARFTHDDVYERTRDLEAFIEYVYYRFQAITTYNTLAVEQGEPFGDEWSKQLLWICGAIEGARDHLLTSGKLIPLIGQVKTLIRYLVALSRDTHLLTFKNEDQEQHESRKELVISVAQRLFTVHSALLMSSGRAKHALIYKIWQAQVSIVRSESSTTDPLGTSFSRCHNLVTRLHGSYHEYLCALEPLLVASQQGLLKCAKDAKQNQVPLARAIIEWLTIVSELSRLATTGFLLPAESLAEWGSADVTERPLSDTSKVREAIENTCKFCIEGALDQLKGMEEAIFGLNDPALLMSFQEARSLATVHMLHMRINMCLSDQRFRWLLSAGCGTCDSQCAAYVEDLTRIEKQCREALQWLRDGRSTESSARIESYLYTIRGAAIAPLPCQDQRARVSFMRAQSVVGRPEAPGDYAAIALALLVEAESKLIRVRRLMCKSCNPDVTEKNMAREVSQVRYGGEGRRESDVANCPFQNSERHLTQVFGLLSSAEQLLEHARSAMDSGCSENKWRMLYHFLRASRAILHYNLSQITDTSTYGRDAQLHSLRLALQDAICALTICGSYSDRRPILRKLLDKVDKHGIDLVGAEAWRKERMKCGIGSGTQPPVDAPPSSESDANGTPNDREGGDASDVRAGYGVSEEYVQAATRRSYETHESNMTSPEAGEPVDDGADHQAVSRRTVKRRRHNQWLGMRMINWVRSIVSRGL